ncbi:LysR substrate-binding domain-containing protein [Bartonella sp. LJL80]
MKIHQLQALVTTADMGSIRAAARKLGLSQPALTRALKELEHEQQLALFIRKPTGLSFTEHGSALLQHARVILNDLHHAENEMGIRRGQPEDRLCIGVAPLMACTFLPAVITLFNQRMPHVQLEIYESLNMVSLPLLRNGTMDMVIANPEHSFPASEFSSEPFLQYQTGILLRHGHPKQNAKSLNELLDEKWVLNYSPETKNYVLNEVFHRHGVVIDENQITRAHSILVSQNLVNHADMCTWCPETFADLQPQSNLKILSLKQKFTTMKLAVISRKNFMTGLSGRTFIACIHTVLAEKSRSKLETDQLFFQKSKLIR